MKQKYEHHPLNAAGDFYVVNGECLTCKMPEHEAPELVGFVEDKKEAHCYFKMQPENEYEIELAIRAVAVSCCSALRYGGKNTAIIQKLKAMQCTHQCDHA